MSNFSLENVPSQLGKVVVVTGGNAGIGLGIAKGLVSKGATVIIASRNQERVNEAVFELKQIHPHSQVEGMILDLSAFSSIEKFVENVKRCCLLFRFVQELFGDVDFVILDNIQRLTF